MSDWNDKVMAEFREKNGNTQMFGRNLVIMHTIGAKSGEARPSPVMGIPEDGAWLVAATAAGAESDPAWAHNLRAHPDIDLEVATADGGVATVAVHTIELAEPDRSVGWKKFTAASANFVSYEQKTDRMFPIFKFSPR